MICIWPVSRPADGSVVRRLPSRGGFLAYTALVLGMLGGCDDAPGNPPDAAPADAALSPSCQEAVDHDDLDWLQDNVFTPSCAAFAACHRGPANAARGLNLETDNTEGNLVGMPSGGFPDQTLVIPGDPANSYLMVVLGSYPGQLSNAGTMPPNNPLLCIQKRDAIERWIAGLPVP